MRNLISTVLYILLTSSLKLLDRLTTVLFYTLYKLSKHQLWSYVEMKVCVIFLFKLCKLHTFKMIIIIVTNIIIHTYLLK